MGMERVKICIIDSSPQNSLDVSSAFHDFLQTMHSIAAKRANLFLA